MSRAAARAFTVSKVSRLRIAVTRSAQEPVFVASIIAGTVHAALARARPSAAVTAIHDSGERNAVTSVVVDATSAYVASALTASVRTRRSESWFAEIRRVSA